MNDGIPEKYDDEYFGKGEVEKIEIIPKQVFSHINKKFVTGLVSGITSRRSIDYSKF